MPDLGFLSLRIRQRLFLCLSFKVRLLRVSFDTPISAILFGINIDMGVIAMSFMNYEMLRSSKPSYSQTKLGNPWIDSSEGACCFLEMIQSHPRQFLSTPKFNTHLTNPLKSPRVAVSVNYELQCSKAFKNRLFPCSYPQGSPGSSIPMDSYNGFS